MTCHARDDARAVPETSPQTKGRLTPTETSRHRDAEPLDPEIEERLAIMTICGEMTETEARAVLGLVPI